MPVFLHTINSGAGGTVVFPAGEIVSSSLELRGDTVYRLEKGCVLRAAAQPGSQISGITISNVRGTAGNVRLRNIRSRFINNYNF